MRPMKFNKHSLILLGIFIAITYGGEAKKDSRDIYPKKFESSRTTTSHESAIDHRVKSRINRTEDLPSVEGTPLRRNTRLSRNKEDRQIPIRSRVPKTNLHKTELNFRRRISETENLDANKTDTSQIWKENPKSTQEKDSPRVSEEIEEISYDSPRIDKNEDDGRAETKDGPETSSKKQYSNLKKLQGRTSISRKYGRDKLINDQESKKSELANRTYQQGATNSKRVNPSSGYKNLETASQNPKSAPLENIHDSANIANGNPLLVENNKKKRRKVLRVRNRHKNNNTSKTIEAKIISNKQVEERSKTSHSPPSFVIKIENVPISKENQQENNTSLHEKDQFSNVGSRQAFKEPVKVPLSDYLKTSENPSTERHYRKEFETVFNPLSHSSENRTLKTDEEKPETIFRDNEDGNIENFPDEHEYSNQNFNLDSISQLKPEKIPEGNGQYMLSYNYMGNKNDQPKDVIKLSEYSVSKKGMVKKAQTIPEKKLPSKKSDKRKANSHRAKNFESKHGNQPQVERLEFAKRFTPLLNNEEKFTEIQDPTNPDIAENYDINRSPVTYKKKNYKKSNEAVWTPTKLEKYSMNEDVPISKKKTDGKILKTDNSDDGFYHSYNNRNPYPSKKKLATETGSQVFIENNDSPKGDSAGNFRKPYNNRAMPAKKQPASSSENKGKYFMHMFKRVGDLSLEHLDSSSGEVPRSDGFMSSIKLSWNDDDRRAHVETSIDSRMQPSTFNFGSSIFQSSLEDNLASELSIQREFPGEISDSAPVENYNEQNIPETSSLKDVKPSTHQESLSRQKRSPNKNAEQFFDSHFTIGKGGPIKLEDKISPNSSEKQRNVPGIPNISQIGTALESPNQHIGTNPQERSDNRRTYLEDKPYYLKPDIKNFKDIYSRKPDSRADRRFTNPEIRSYYLKPEDTKEIKRLTNDFHTQQLHFPFEAYRRTNQENGYPKQFQSQQAPKQVTNKSPGLGVYYSDSKEQHNVQALPRNNNFKIIPISSNNNGNVDFHSSYKIPSETQIIPSTIKLTQNPLEDIRNRMRKENPDTNPTISTNDKLPLNKNTDSKTAFETNLNKNVQMRDPPKFHRRTGPLNTQKVPQPLLSDNAQTIEKENQFNNSSVLQKRRNENTNVEHYQDAVKHAASQQFHQLSKNSLNNYPLPEVQNVGREASRSIGPHAWEYGFEHPDANSNSPRFNSIPKTSFDCKGKYGYHADPETGCQVFHMCQGRGAKHSFLCPNNTIFNQQLLVCDWHNRVNCDDSTVRSRINDHLYSRNANSNNIRKSHDDAGRQWKWAAQQARTNNYGSFKRRKANADRTDNSERQLLKKTSDDLNYLDENDIARRNHRNNARPQNYVLHKLQGSGDEPKTSISLPNSLPNNPENDQNSNKDIGNKVQQDGNISDQKPQYHNDFRSEKTVGEHGVSDNKTNPQEFRYYKENEYFVHNDKAKPGNDHQEVPPLIYEYHERNNKGNLNPHKIQDLQTELKRKPFSENKFTTIQPSIVLDMQDRKHLYRLNSNAGKPKETHFDAKLNHHETIKPQKKVNTAIAKIPVTEKPRYYQENINFATTSAPLRDYATTLHAEELRTEIPRSTTYSHPVVIKQYTTPSTSIPVPNKQEGDIIKKNTIHKHVSTLNSDFVTDHGLGDIQKLTYYKPAVSMPENHKSSADPKMLVYTYPLQPITRKTGQTKQSNYGERIANTNKENEQTTLKLQQGSPRNNATPQRYIDMEKKNSPSINVTSRIADVISRLQTIGTGVSQILEGKDNLYKSINIHKLKPMAPSQKDLKINFDPFAIVKFPKTIEDSKSIRTDLKMQSVLPDISQNTNTEKNIPTTTKNIELDGVSKKLNNTNEPRTTMFNTILNKSYSMPNSESQMPYKNNQRNIATSLRNEFHKVIRVPTNAAAHQTYRQNDGVNLHVQGRTPVNINPLTKYDRKSLGDSNLKQVGVFTNVKPHGYVVKIHPLRNKGTVKEIRHIQNKNAQTPNIRNGHVEGNVNQPNVQNMRLNNYPTTTQIPQYDKNQMFTSQNPPSVVTNSNPGISSRNVNQAEVSQVFHNNHLKLANPYLTVHAKPFNHQKNLDPRNPAEKYTNEKYHQGTRSRHAYYDIPQSVVTPSSNNKQHSVTETVHHSPFLQKINGNNFRENDNRHTISINTPRSPVTSNFKRDQHTFTTTEHNVPAFTGINDINGNNFRKGHSFTEIVRHTTPFPNKDKVNGNSYQDSRDSHFRSANVLQQPSIPNLNRDQPSVTEAIYSLPPPQNSIKLNENNFKEAMSRHKHYNNVLQQGATPSPNTLQHTVTESLHHAKPTEPIKNSISKKYFQGIRGRQTYNIIPQRGTNLNAHVSKMMPHSKPSFPQNNLPAFIFTVNPSQESLNWKSGQKYNPGMISKAPSISPPRNKHLREHKQEVLSRKPLNENNYDPDCDESSDETPDHLSLGKYGPNYRSIQNFPKQDAGPPGPSVQANGRTVTDEESKENGPHNCNNKNKQHPQDHSKPTYEKRNPTDRLTIPMNYKNLPTQNGFSKSQSLPKTMQHRKYKPKTRSSIKEKEQVSIKPMKFFHSQFLSPTMTKNYEGKKPLLDKKHSIESGVSLEAPNKLRNVRSSEEYSEASKDSHEDSGSIENDRKVEYRELERAAELEAEKMVKSTTKSTR